MSWPTCVRCGCRHLPSQKLCDPKAQQGTIAAAFNLSSQPADLAEAVELMRWNAAKGLP